MNLELQPKKILLLLLGALLIIAVLHIVSWVPVFLGQQDYTIIFFDVTEEGNIPTLFSTCLLLINGLLTLMIAYAERSVRGRFLYWLVLGLAFLWMGMDETIMIHEYISDWLHAHLQTTGIFRFAWVIPYGIAVLIFIAFYTRFFLSLPTVTKKWLSISGTVYLLGAVGMEMLGSYRYDGHGFDSVYNIINGFEELTEMTGAILLIYTFLNYLAREHPDLTVCISDPSAKD